jgi:hypothetical protein
MFFDEMGAVMEEQVLEAPSEDYRRQVRVPWIMQHVNYYHNKDVSTKVLGKEEFVWSSDASDDVTSECSVDSADSHRYFHLVTFASLDSNRIRFGLC